MQMKKTPAANTNSMGVSSASAMFGGIPEIVNFVASNVSPGYSPQQQQQQSSILIPSKLG
jgi:hypothetical protein